MAAPAAVRETEDRSVTRHAWERGPWLWRLLLPALLAVGVIASVTDPDTSPRRAGLGAALAVTMVLWYLVMRPDRIHEPRPIAARRAVAWGLGAVLLWLPLVLVHPAFFFVLTGLFPTIFSVVPFRPAIGLACLLGIEITVANLYPGDPSMGLIAVTFGWVGVTIAMSIALAWWIHGIIEQSQDRHHLIEALEATRHDLARAERTAGALEERAHLTREIHDTLAQGFTSIVMVLQAAEATMAPDDASRRAVRLAIDTARDNLDDARRLIADLDPGPLDTGSLPEALRRAATRFGDETGVSVDVALTGDQRQLPAASEVALLRAAHESLANVSKHAGARHVTITLRYDDRVTLEVIDDGAGFDPAGSTDGFGLRGMRDRLASVDGEVHVASQPGSGTTVLVAVP